MTEEQRFWGRINKTDTCWLWTGAKSKTGYGNLKFLNVFRSAHRVSWALTFGGIPEGMCVLHKCDVRNCVNPAHLFLGSNRDNTRDMIAKGRGRSSFPVLRGSAHGRSKLTETEVLEIRSLFVPGTKKSELARIYGVTYQCIHDILRRKIWRHV